MSLQFVFGPSGAGKSTQLYHGIIRKAAENKKKNYLVIVPDQFTMQTQKDLVALSPSGGILNIDVLSFGRLNHRIMEEVGREEIPVLDDTGKSLVLQKVAAGLKEEMPVLGSYLHKQGYIHEVKSAVSEFMQYGIGAEDVSKLITYAQKRGALVQKLKDLQTIYKGFLTYISGKFITTEETLDVLCRALPKSALLQGSVVVFDGFTGFTPIQYRVIRELMLLCEQVIITVTMGADENPYQQDGEQKLFHLGKKTVADLEKIASEAGVKREVDLFVLPAENAIGAGKTNNLQSRAEYVVAQSNRFRENPALAHLEQNLFRFTMTPFLGKQEQIRLYEATNPRMEVRQAGLEIKKLVLEKGLCYRDIAVIIGNLEAYAPFVETEFEQMEIPCFVDRTRGIVLNPMVEFIKSGLELYLKDFSYEAVFHYLRSGLADIEPEEVDRFENYIRVTGIRGYKKYSRLFTHKTKAMGEDEEALQQINAIRERLMRQIEMLHLEPQETVKEYVDKLYEFLIQNEVQRKLAVWENFFAENAQATREREYAQIYRLVMQLLEQIYELLGEEKITLQEFADILEAGFGEIEVGTIPQNVDRVLVGDMERTRLKQIKVLFFLGVNDGNIPKNASKGGIISDVDREFLRESELELAPSPRQQMFIQRLYLYLNMTKPSQYLYLGYSKVDSAGKSMRPAYLVDTIRKLFPAIQTEYPELRSALEQIVTGREGAAYLAEGLREYVSGAASEDREREIFTIYQAFKEEELASEKEFLTEAAFRRYQGSALSKVVAQALYGRFLENSVSRLETYAACAYQHFLQYGLALKERGEFSFERVDLGNIYHEVLEKFAGKLAENNRTWFDFEPDYAEMTVKDALQEVAAAYGDNILYSSARNEYALTRMSRVLVRTVLTIQRQLKKGDFCPESYEVTFRFTDNLSSVNVSLSEEERMRIKGRIDRVDTLEDGDNVYVKVVDYKSGTKQFDLAALYYGLQLQLVVYMNAALELEAREHPDKQIVPAALLYYHIDDPVVEMEEVMTPEDIDNSIAKALCMKGVVNSDAEIARKIDHTLSAFSDVIPVGWKKDGEFSAKSSVLSGEDLHTLSDFVTKKIISMGKEILNGEIVLQPYEMNQEKACTWCSYKGVCGFDPSIPGCETRKLPKLDAQEVLNRMKEGENTERREN